MQYDKSNFFHHFNMPKRPNYSYKELVFELEIKSALKSQKLTDKKLLKPTK